MKKKLLAFLMFTLMGFTFMGCDLLSTIQAATGFYSEYQKFSPIYENATHMTVQTDTDLTISNTNIADMQSMSSKLYFMDNGSAFTYVDETLNSVRTKSVYEETGNSNLPIVQYLIGDNNVVTPMAPEGEVIFNSNTQIFNSNFNYQDVSNENKTGDRTYEFDIYLNQVINLSALDNFVNQLKLFDETLSGFNNAEAHVIVTFSDTDSAIDIHATVSDYTLSFDNDKSVTFSISNHTVLKVPTEFQMPDVFSSDYQMKAVDNMELARKTYEVGDTIAYPVTSGENGYAKLNLTAGNYAISSDHLSDIVGSKVYDASGNEITVNTTDMSFTVNADGTYYLYIMPTASFESDIQVLSVSPTSNTTS